LTAFGGCPLTVKRDFALLDCGPLLAGMAVELVAGARRHGDGLQAHLTRRIFLQRHRKMPIVLQLRRRRLRPNARRYAGCHEHCWDDQFVYEFLPVSRI